MAFRPVPWVALILQNPNLASIISNKKYLCLSKSTLCPVYSKLAWNLSLCLILLQVNDVAICPNHWIGTCSSSSSHCSCPGLSLSPLFLGSLKESSIWSVCLPHCHLHIYPLNCNYVYLHWPPALLTAILSRCVSKNTKSMWCNWCYLNKKVFMVN